MGNKCNSFWRANAPHHKATTCLETLNSNQRSHTYHQKVQVGKDQEKAQSERDSHSKNRGGKKQTNNQALIP